MFIIQLLWVYWRLLCRAVMLHALHMAKPEVGKPTPWWGLALKRTQVRLLCFFRADECIGRKLGAEIVVSFFVNSPGSKLTEEPVWRWNALVGCYSPKFKACHFCIWVGFQCPPGGWKMGGGVYLGGNRPATTKILSSNTVDVHLVHWCIHSNHFSCPIFDLLFCPQFSIIFLTGVYIMAARELFDRLDPSQYIVQVCVFLHDLPCFPSENQLRNWIFVALKPTAQFPILILGCFPPSRDLTCDLHEPILNPSGSQEALKTQSQSQGGILHYLCHQNQSIT